MVHGIGNNTPTLARPAVIDPPDQGHAVAEASGADGGAQSSAASASGSAPLGGGPADAGTNGVAHEFNNLLTVVLGSLEQLGRQTLDQRGREQLERALWGVRQADRLARRMLSAPGLGSGEPLIVDVNAVVAEFGGMLGQIAGERVALSLELASRPLSTRLDPGLLQLALLNLVRSAADASGSGGSITIRTEVHGFDGQGGPTVEISVAATHGGMTEDGIERAAEPFLAIQGSDPGTGPCIVHRFAAACGGKVAIDPAVGGGTTVRLMLPWIAAG